MPKADLRRIIVKISGEALGGPDGFGLHQPTVDRIAADLVAARDNGVTLGVVVGGGNLFRGVGGTTRGLARATGDAIGMLATVMNSLSLEAAIERAGSSARTLSAVAMPQICENYSRQAGLAHLAKNRIVLFAGGIANPYFTTDTTAVLRAVEMGCDAVLKATNVDGVYSADPKLDSTAKRFDRLTHEEALSRNLKVMDATAFALARENQMPIIVFSIQAAGAVAAVLRGEGRATTVSG